MIKRAVFVMLLAGCAKNIALPEVKAPTSADAIARGAYLAENVGVCTTCHTPRDFRSFSGLPITEHLGTGSDIGMVFGYFPPRVVMWAPNITPSTLSAWTDAEIQRAFVSGIGRDGKPLMLAMPYDQYNALSKDDAAAIVAYLRSLTPQVSVTQPRKLPFPLEPFIINLMPMESHLVERTPTPQDGLVYGKYLATIAGCLWCHSPMSNIDQVVKGKEWSGNHAFPLPTPGDEPGSVVRGVGVIRTPNISNHLTGIGPWTKDAFIARFKAMNRDALANVKPVIGEMNSMMPWPAYSGMTEDDLGAIYDYIRSFPPQDSQVVRFEPDAGRP